MPKKKPSESEFAAVQVRSMKNLAPNAAAWLLGVSPRALRDFLNLERDGNGRYDAQALVEFAVRRGKRPTLPDETIEQFIVIVEELGFGEVEMIRTAYHQLTELRDKHGTGVLLEFVELLLADWQQFVESDKRPPDETDMAVTEALRGVPKGTVAAEHALRIATVCPDCRRLRVGRSWRKKQPPKDHVVLEHGRRCPKCEEN